MPIDPNFLPALEQELEFARQVAPGGQKADPGRIAAIEEQIKLHKAAAKKQAPKEENASNVSTDYQSHDADAGTKRAAKSEKPSKRGVVDADDDKAEKARAAQEKAETADATTEKRETADA